MAIYKGDKKVIALYKGDKPILKRYKGTELIYELKTKNETLSFAWSGTSTSQTFKINSTSYTASTNPYTTTLTDLGIEDFTSARDMFGYRSAITAVTSIPDTSEVTSMSNMFVGCTGLKSLDVITTFDTSNVTSMGNMFSGCTKLNTLDVSGFDTSKVTSFDSMFYYCSGLTSLDVSNWNTSSLNNLYQTFAVCTKLNTLDVSNWNTSNVTNMANAFNNCSNLTTLDVSRWDTSKVTNMNGMFSYSPSLSTLDLSNWNVSNVTNMYGMLQNCGSLTSLDLSRWNITNVTNMVGMFKGCGSLTSLDLSNWNVSGTDIDQLINGCTNLTTLNLSNWDTSNVGTSGNMFNGCTSLTSVIMNGCSCDTIQFIKDRLSEAGLDVSIVTSDSSCTDNLELYADSAPLVFTLNDTQYTANTTHYSMYYSDTLTNCNGAFSGTSLNNIIAFPDTSNVSDMSYMFKDCSGLTSLEVSSGFNVSNVTNMYSMFEGCSGLTSLDLTNWYTSNVTTMSYMFYSCSGLTSLNLSFWDFSNVSDMSSMFTNCSSLSSLNLDGCVINTGITYSYSGMFDYCPLSSISMYGCNCDTIKFIADRLIDATIVSTYEEAKYIIQTENIDCLEDSTLAAPAMLEDCNTPINVLYVNHDMYYTYASRFSGGEGARFDTISCGQGDFIYIPRTAKDGDSIEIYGTSHVMDGIEVIDGIQYNVFNFKNITGDPLYLAESTDTDLNRLGIYGIFYYQ